MIGCDETTVVDIVGSFGLVVGMLGGLAILAKSAKPPPISPRARRRINERIDQREDHQ